MREPILVIGAGPAGLATAACLGPCGIPYRLVDRKGLPGGAYRQMFGGIQLASPTKFNGLPGLDLTSGEYHDAAAYGEYLDRYAVHHGIAVERGEVRRIAREPAGFSVDLDGETLHARAVVIATGLWGHPRAFELPGATLEIVHTQKWRGPEAHPHERILIVGGGMSAVETAEQCARAGRRVWISARRGISLTPQSILGLDVHHFIVHVERLPTWLAGRWCREPHTLPPTNLGFSKLRDAGRIEVVGAITRCEGNEIHFADGKQGIFDLVVAATGFRFDAPFVPAEVARAPAGHLVARKCESVSWPGLFTIGSRCANGLASEFLRGIARDAELIAHRL